MTGSTTKLIPLSQGAFALVDADDYDALVAAGPWHLKPNKYNRYARSTDRGGRKRLYMHSLLTGWRLTDHINGDGLDNRRANLRPATDSQNQANKKKPVDNTSGFKGVYFKRDANGWIAKIVVRGKFIYLGRFASAEDAARAYDAAALEHFGEFARINFPAT